jgi:hypothetical protein
MKALLSLETIFTSQHGVTSEKTYNTAVRTEILAMWRDTFTANKYCESEYEEALLL